MNLETVSPADFHRWIGAVPNETGGCRFAVWAPNCDSLVVDLVDQQRTIPLTKQDGYHMVDVERVAVGERYYYRVPERTPRPDPASRFQPDGVHGPSQVVSRQYPWSDDDWRGISPDDLVIYELHVGTFTDEGTFAAAIGRLDELIDLGVTAVELMPLADSAGRWNWGYDGVCLFSPNASFGSPDSLRRLVDAAHARGLAVILDVVYNHLGPEGNYLSEFGPYLSPKHATAWGDGPNFDDPVVGRDVRRFFCASAVHWLDQYHIDGLRVDAIHCMRDDSDHHITAELAETVRDWSKTSSRTALLIAETNVYDPEMTRPVQRGGIGYDAQWCDDFLHSVFAVVRPGEQLSDRSYRPGSDLQQTLQMGFVHQGTVRQARQRMPISRRVDTHRMVYSIQNHDFIGNHPLGKRLHQLTSAEIQKAAAALLLLSPPIPMLFMGEEFACENPFRFFVDFGDQSLRRLVVRGRRREYPQHDWSEGISPVDPEAYYASKIGRAERGDASMRTWYRDLIQIRKQGRSSGWLSDESLTVDCQPDRGLYVLNYRDRDEEIVVAVRLAAAPERDDGIPLSVAGERLLDSRPGDCDEKMILPNHAVVLRSRSHT